MASWLIQRQTLAPLMAATLPFLSA
jgi:hypothetical protein